MNDLHKRWAMFLLGCIPSRFLLAYVLSKLSQTRLKLAGLVLLLPAIGFMYIYLTGSRKTGAETRGAPIWWNNLRPIHALFYLVSATMAFQGDTRAYMPIVIDTLFGLVAFICYHF
jgi:hypothetical protein